MKVLAMADVHQSERHWEMLVKAVEKEKPDLVLIAGDLLPKYEGILAQVLFVHCFKDYASAIRAMRAELILILGNDDNQLMIPEMEKGDRGGLWHYIPDRARKVKGYEFCGCPWIRDYPFAYKYWVAPDSPGEVYIDPIQLGPPAVINSDNDIEIIPDLGEYLKGKLSVKESLENMAGQVNNLEQSIWLIHDPPSGMELDLCATGNRVGNPAVYQFLLERQPLLSIHGHIHEAPTYNGGIWAAKIGKTWCIQAGQVEHDLSYVTFNLDQGKVKNLRHSLYGNQVSRRQV